MDPNEYRVVLACAPTRISDKAGGEATNCSYGQTACRYRYPTSDPRSQENLLRLESRPKGQPNGGWTLVREMCGPDQVPPGVPVPQVPTLAQIQTAFKRLPFSKPTVSIQPVGNVTLVNLPTYYRATWPGDAGLEPGETSKPVKLLSWNVEFRIMAQSYDFHYGDGQSSGPTSDAGGVYPDGGIRHTYQATSKGAQVTVDAKLTAQYRANGGDWQDIDAVADLQDEPVTTLVVKEARARLVTH
nr:hypothetical protein [Knoellia sp. DB2414S]